MKKQLLLLIIILLAISTKSKSQHLEWARNIPGYISDVKTDSIGSLFVFGSYIGTVDFDPGPGIFNLNEQTDGNIFLQKTDSTGNLLWVKTFQGGGYSPNVGKLIIDNEGNILLAGGFEDTIDADPGPNVLPFYGQGDYDSYMLKLDPLGNLIWAHVIASTDQDLIYSLCTDSQNDIYYSGYTRDTIDVDPGPGVYLLNGNWQGSGIVFKLDKNGNFRFAKMFGNASWGTCVIYHPQGFIIVSGVVGYGFDFDPGPGQTYFSGTYGDGFLLELDTAGNYVWAKQLGGTPFETIFDNDFNLIVTGVGHDTLDYDPGSGYYPLNCSPQNTIFALKLDSAFNFQWAYKFGDINSGGIGWSIIKSKNNSLYITGVFNGILDADPGPSVFNLYAANTSGHYLLNLNENGNFIRAYQFTPDFPGNVNSFDIDQNDNIYMAGLFNGIVDFDPGPAYNFLSTLPGYANSYLLKFEPDTCNYLAVTFQNVSDVNCVSNGNAEAIGLLGTPPYQYEWSTIPPDFDSVATFNQSGIYTVTVTDANSCTQNAYLLINAPLYPSQFDLELIISAATFIPGQNTSVTISAANNGCVSTSGFVTMVLDSLTSFVMSSPPPGLILGDTIYWWFNNLSNNTSAFQIQLYLVTDTNAVANDEGCLLTYVSPMANDVDSTNNTKNYCFTVRNSFDPNDKQVFPKGKCDEKYVIKNDPLIYTIRFQNTGNAVATNVLIQDSLDLSIDINSLRIVASSHPLFTEIAQGNVLKFHFDNINLPDSGSNLPASNGFVIYEVLADSMIADGTIIKNRAFVLFDFNEVIVTNEVHNTMVSVMPSIDTSITINGTTLSANNSNAIYQWINCSNNSIIPGAIWQTFTPVQNGNYAVIISEGNCLDTSGCYQITTVGLDNIERNQVLIYPNPVKDYLMIIVPYEGVKYEITISDISGKVVSRENYFVKNKQITINTEDFQHGSYILKIQCDQFVKTRKIVLID